VVIRALNRKMFRDFAGLRAQVFTTASLIACGVGLLVSTWSAYSSFRDSRDRYYRDFAFADVFADLKRAPLDVGRRIAAIPGVDRIETRIVIDGLIEDRVSSAEAPATGRFISIPPGGQPRLNQLFLRKGRLPERGDETEVVVHEAFARAHRLEPGSSLTIQVQGTRERVRIVGIALSPEYIVVNGPAAPLPDDVRFGVIWIPVPAMERLARMTDAFNSLAMRVPNPADLNAVKARADELLRPYGSRGAYGRDQQASSRFVEDEITQQKTTSVISPAIFLGIAAFLVHVIASRLIAIHRPQIAVLKAIGYSHLAVSTHYLGLITLMTISGTIPGIFLGRILGALMAKSYERFFHFPGLDFSLSIPAAGIGLVAGLIPGVLGAAGSIRSAFRLAPAESMRPPAPIAYSKGLFERLRLKERLSIRQRMVWRTLLLKPYRLAMTLAGLSMATCVVIVSMAWFDIVDFLLETQFQMVQRENLSISLISPVTRSGLQEISRLDGVISVEGYRVTPVRLRYLNFKRELPLTGWPESASMRQQLDLDRKPVPLPRHGILLSRYFEKEWGLKVGQEIGLETLEGRPRSLRVLVGGFTDDLLGISASMRIEELWGLLSEQTGYNLATLLVDPRAISRLYSRLTGMPQVAAVNLKSALYRGYRDSIGGMILVMSAILIAFALVIAGGIIYNSMSVSFSERAWELASLRVIGFSRESVFSMLMSEVATLVIVSLAPGCLLGLGLTHLILESVSTESFGFPLIILPRTYATGILTAIVALALSGAVVRRRMKRLSLADALKARE
jgi:putative ABC transport system permease protein